MYNVAPSRLSQNDVKRDCDVLRGWNGACRRLSQWCFVLGRVGLANVFFLVLALFCCFFLVMFPIVSFLQ